METYKFVLECGRGVMAGNWNIRMGFLAWNFALRENNKP
jgi:hypothetical protein